MNWMNNYGDSNMWGHHLIIDAGGCAKACITDPEYLKVWVKDLVNVLKMKAYGEPLIVHFGTGEDHLAGWTVIQLIETSNIMAHFCDNTQQAYIDVFSCKPFDVDQAVGQIRRYFAPKSIRPSFLTRHA